MKKIFSIALFLFLLTNGISAQVVSDSVATDTLIISPADTVDVSDLKVDEVEMPEEAFIVLPWQEDSPLASEVIANDSLLRWQVWPGWSEFQAYRRDAISYRLGTAASLDAFHIKGYLPYEQELFMEGMDLKNPVTGLVNYNFVPHRKISVATEEFTGSYVTRVDLKDYYLLQPISYLNYDESSLEYRNLEFMVSQNITDRTNLELSYWDRRDGGYYPNNEVKGSQIFGKAYHHLSERLLLRALYMRNNYEKNEPFGYVVSDPLSFPFDQFTSTPMSSSGASELNRWDLVTGIYHRRDTSSAEDAGFELSLSSNRKEIASSSDTTSWDIRTLNGRLFKKVDLSILKLNAEINAQSNQVKGTSSINIDDWFLLNSMADAGINLGPALFYAKAKYNLRSDDENGFNVSSGLKTSLRDRMNIELNASYFSRIPTIQAKFWDSQNYRGNENLRNEIGYSYTATSEIKLFDRVTVGASWRYKNAKRTTFLSAESIFFNSNVYEQYSAGIFGKFESSLIELESSAIAQRTDHCCVTENSYLNELDEVLWLRNSAFVKGYVFDRAAYLKIGIKTLFSPLYYSSRTFNTELQYWQGGSNYTDLPPFFRLDAELSARVRAIMVVLRWENALDGMGQAGYFETAGYPMPPRRLIVGIRAQFRN